jgi:hypothetical protein
MKSDRILLQEAALQAEFKNAASHDKSEEVFEAKTTHTKTSKLNFLPCTDHSSNEAAHENAQRH